MGQDEQGPLARAAEQQLQRPLGHVDRARLAVPSGAYDEHLAVGDVDPSWPSTATLSPPRLANAFRSVSVPPAPTWPL